MSHTQGKLTVSEIGVGFELDDEKGRCIAQTQQLCAIKNAEDHDERKANARRLVACWNACDGISTESLEMAAALGGLRDVSPGAAVFSQRDELLEALQMIASMGLDALQCRDTARAAIARAQREKEQEAPL